MDTILLFLGVACLIFSTNGDVYSDGGIEGQSGLISCFFDYKFPGDVVWENNGVEYTFNCQVIPPGDAILETGVECNGNANPGPANFTFNILSLDKNRDDDLWVCKSPSLNEPLTMDVKVLPNSVEYSGPQEVDPNEYFELTATTSCQYPADKEIAWCVESQCSDESDDYWEGVFKDRPDEAISNESCNKDYNSPMVYKLVNTISATTEDSKYDNNVLLYAKVNNVPYKGKSLTINFKILGCGPFFVCSWMPILLIILIILVIIYLLFRPSILPIRDFHFKLVDITGINLPLDPVGFVENIENIDKVYFVLKDKNNIQPVATLNFLKGLVCDGKIKNYSYFAIYYDGNPIFYNDQHPPRMTPDIENRTGFIVSYKYNNEHSQTRFLNINCDTYLLINENEHERIEESFASKIHQSITPDLTKTLKKTFASKFGVNDNGKNNCAISTENVRYQFQIYASTTFFKSPLMGILDRDLNVIGLIEDKGMVVSNIGTWKEGIPIWQEGCCSSLFNRNTRLLKVQIGQDEFDVNGKVKGSRHMTNVSVLVGDVAANKSLLAIRNKEFNFIAIVSDEGMLKNVNCVNLYNRLRGISVFEDKLQPATDLLLIHEYYLPFWERWELKMKKYYQMPVKQ